MYALLSARTDGEEFLAARDPVGIKPLYWTPPESSADGSVRFASELAAFDRAWRGAVEAFPPGCVWTAHTGIERFALAGPDGPAEDDGGLAEPDEATLRRP